MEEVPARAMKATVATPVTSVKRITMKKGIAHIFFVMVS